MSDWLFVDIPAKAVDGLDESDFPYPIRRERMAGFEELKQEGFPVVFAADELDLYLDEHPTRADRYRKQGSQLFLCAALDLHIDHCYEPSLHYYKLAIWLDPGNLTARMDYGATLHYLQRSDEAIEQYRYIMAHGHIYHWWRAWMLCAQVLMALGRKEEALALLHQAQQGVPEDDQFWMTLAACKESLRRHCPQCGQELKEAMRFCGNCGARLEDAAAATSSSRYAG